jgi:hypothetical protein
VWTAITQLKHIFSESRSNQGDFDKLLRSYRSAIASTVDGDGKQVPPHGSVGAASSQTGALLLAVMLAAAALVPC